MHSISLLMHRQGGKHSCTARTGSYLESAIELPHSLSHPGNSNSKRCRAFNLLKLFGAHAMTIVFYFQGYFLPAAGQDHTYRSPARVPEYVVHTFLHDAKERSLPIRG